MPRSRHRHKHHHHAEPAHPGRTAKAERRSAVTILVIFIGILGAGVALIATGARPLWLLTGTLAGAVVGYFIGQRMDRLAKR